MKKLNRHSTYILLSVLFILVSGALKAQDELTLHLRVTELTEAGPPVIIENSILLTYKPEKHVRFVGAAFSHENFRTIHTYRYNDRGVYFLVIPMPRIESIRYRIIVDGLWLQDPSAPERIRDSAGLYLSVIPIPTSYREQKTLGPQILPDGRVRFTFTGEPGNNVSIAGDFNNWDPFMHYLREESPGTYTLTIRMLPGRYNYYFFYDGTRVPDPWNTIRRTLQDGLVVSTLQVPPSS